MSSLEASSSCFVEVYRGDRVESRHRVHVAVAHAERGLIAHCGESGYVSYVRSAIKMFQALPLVEDGGVERFALTDEEIAVTVASHGGEPFHVAAARAILHKAGSEEHLLACGPHPPMHVPSADALAESGIAPARIHNNCSGKHAGMLACAKLHNWPLVSYFRLHHPLQQRIVSTLARWCDISGDGMTTATDGCGLPTFALPLERVALGCARLAAAADDGEPAVARVIGAMTRNPEYVAGTDRLCTDLMRHAEGRVFAKVGAEGYYCAGSPAARIGIALKVEDGAKRASEPALLATLRALDLITPAEIESLRKYARPLVFNTRGEEVGALRVALSLV